MNRYVGLSLFLVSVLLVATLSHGDDLPEGLLCPVSGEEVDPELSCGYREGKVYFCCDNCVNAFAADTTPYATKANLQLILTGQAAQKACPITGKDTQDDVTVSVGGVDVALCCGNCRKKVEGASGDEQLALVFGDTPFDKAFVVTPHDD